MVKALKRRVNIQKLYFSVQTRSHITTFTSTISFIRLNRIPLNIQLNASLNKDLNQNIHVDTLNKLLGNLSHVGSRFLILDDSSPTLTPICPVSYIPVRLASLPQHSRLDCIARIAMRQQDWVSLMLQPVILY